jgi:hypothetical protein
MKMKAIDLVGFCVDCVMKAALLLGLVTLFGCGGGLEESYFEPRFTGAEMEVTTEEDGTVAGMASGGMAFGPIQAGAEVGGAFGEESAWVRVVMRIKYLAAFQTHVSFECDFLREVCNICARSMGTEVCRDVDVFTRREVAEKPAVSLQNDIQE